MFLHKGLSSYSCKNIGYRTIYGKMATNLHIWPLICILRIIHTAFYPKHILILFFDLHCLWMYSLSLLKDRLLCRNCFKNGAKIQIWRPFCLCKLSGQDGQISLGNRVNRIQRTHIRLKSMVPRFYPKMPLGLFWEPFFRISTRLHSFRNDAEMM